MEGKGILFNLDLAECVSAFLHLAFVFNMRYAKKSETVCDFLQRIVAEYGNDEGLFYCLLSVDKVNCDIFRDQNLQGERHS